MKPHSLERELKRILTNRRVLADQWTRWTRAPAKSELYRDLSNLRNEAQIPVLRKTALNLGFVPVEEGSDTAPQELPDTSDLRTRLSNGISKAETALGSLDAMLRKWSTVERALQKIKKGLSYASLADGGYNLHKDLASTSCHSVSGIKDVIRLAQRTKPSLRGVRRFFASTWRTILSVLAFLSEVVSAVVEKVRSWLGKTEGLVTRAIDLVIDAVSLIAALATGNAVGAAISAGSVCADVMDIGAVVVISGIETTSKTITTLHAQLTGQWHTI